MSDKKKEEKKEGGHKIVSGTEALRKLCGTTTAEGKPKRMSFADLCDKSAAEQGILYSSLNEDNVLKGSMSTGALCFDLFMGNGHAPGRFSAFVGPTGSCKTTTMVQSLVEPLDRGIPIHYLDYESALDPSYMEKLNVQLEHALGTRGRKGGWDSEPKLWPSTPPTCENGLRMMLAILRGMPNKVAMDDQGELRYFCFDQSLSDKPISWAAINKGLADELIYEVEDGSPQAVFVIDSVASMPPESTADNSEDASIAALARGLSKYLPHVKGLLGRKICNLICTNQVKINPMARFQNPETEPGGSAVQYYADTKVRLNVNRAANKLIDESHVSGVGYDRYLMGTATIIKNKGGSSMRKMGYRVWTDEAGEPGRGIDPVFDTYQFLLQTNQLSVLKDGKYRFQLDGFSLPEMEYMAFKKFVLTEPEYDKVRAALREQMRVGTAQTKYYEHIKMKSSKEKPAAGKKGFGGVTSIGAGTEAEDEAEDVESHSVVDI